MAGFFTDRPSTLSGYKAELYATVRENGRIVDHVRYAIGGDTPMKAVFKMGVICEEPEFEDFTVVIQRRTEDIDLRKGLLTSNWVDIIDLVSARDASIHDGAGAEILAGDFLRLAKEHGATVGSIRWGVVLDDSSRLAVQLQGLPAPASILNGKPSLKR